MGNCDGLKINKGLASLLSMLRFYAAEFVMITSRLGIVKHCLKLIGGIKPNIINTLEDDLGAIKEHCQSLQLPLSIMHIELAQAYLSENRQNLSQTRLVSYIDEIHLRVLDELQAPHFLYLPQGKIEFYEKSKKVFGQQCLDKLTNATYDIEEAGKCLAFGRSTACVFHLMRVMELAVQEIGTKLGVSLASEQNWHVILDQIDKAIREMPHKTRDEKEAQNKYAMCSSFLFNVKVAWRNEVMHPRAKYTEDEATDIFTSVRTFIQYLAKEIIS